MRTRIALLVAAICLSALAAYAQPTDAQILKDIASPKQLKVELVKGTTKKVWSDAHAQWFWERGATIWLPADVPEFPNAKVVVYGFARYHTGNPPSYREWKTSLNEYEGIPAPTREEILAHARKYLKDFVGEYRYNRMVDLKSIAVAADPKTVWHTPLSFSMQFDVVADVIISDVEVATESTRQETRFYREKVSDPWRSFMVTVERDVQHDNKRSYSPEDIRAMETIGSREQEAQAQAALAALGDVTIPDFARDVDVFMHTHKLLREGTAAQFEAYLIRMLAPVYFVEGSSTRLTPQGADLVNKAVNNAFKGKSTYAQQYCPDPGVKSQQPDMMEWWNATQDAHVRMALTKAGGTWKNGQKTGETYKITALEVWMLTSADDIARINSYEPGMLCKGNAAPVSSGGSSTSGQSGAAPQQSGGNDILKKGKGLLNKLTTP
ncbi:MAG: hypothetical protein IPJ76_07290 [Flavobacteriales bacterium]|nr:MAG: hypothetical protein IPJ76_07290 [Flavobacteriales bacterium]